MCKKESFVVSAAVVLAVAVMLLFPMSGTAGNLEPSAAPGPTMKTLDQIPPTWSQTLPADQRFQLVLNDAAVLDKETGLVWEKSPSTTTVTWIVAMYTCYNKKVGNRQGWRLPTVEELESLVDPSTTHPSLPSGHPFTNVQPVEYWSSTTLSDYPSHAWVVFFGGGNVDYFDKTDFNGNYVWCVRGGQGYDGH